MGRRRNKKEDISLSMNEIKTLIKSHEEMENLDKVINPKLEELKRIWKEFEIEDRFALLTISIEDITNEILQYTLCFQHRQLIEETLSNFEEDETGLIAIVTDDCHLITVTEDLVEGDGFGFLNLLEEMGLLENIHEIEDKEEDCELCKLDSLPIRFLQEIIFRLFKKRIVVHLFEESTPRMSRREILLTNEMKNFDYQQKNMKKKRKEKRNENQWRVALENAFKDEQDLLFQLKNETKPIYSLEDMELLLVDPNFGDISLRIENRILHAHKKILRDSNSYFAAMFGGNMKESSMKEVVMENIPFEFMKALLQFLYTNMFKISNLSNALCILQFSDMFVFDRLKSIVQQLIIPMVNKSNLRMIKSASETYSAKELIIHCQQVEEAIQKVSIFFNVM